VFVGGKFAAVEDATRTSTVTRDNLVAFSATSGDISSTFKPSVDGMVFAVRAIGDSV
jgi:hypothetical protein